MYVSPFIKNSNNKCLFLFIFSLLLRFIHDRFDNDLGLTIGVDFKTKTVNIDGNAVKLAIWVILAIHVIYELYYIY